MWAKQPLSCNCAKRTKGRPRVGNGMCSWGERGRIYRWRNQARELNHLARRRGVDWESDEVAILCNPKSVVEW